MHALTLAGTMGASAATMSGHVSATQATGLQQIAGGLARAVSGLLAPETFPGTTAKGEHQVRMQPAVLAESRAGWLAMQLMAESLPPYAATALEPYLSARTVIQHCDSLGSDGMRSVLQGLEAVDCNTSFAGKGLEAMVRHVARLDASRPELRRMTECVCTLHNHALYWRSMKPGGGGRPKGKLMDAIVSSFGSWEAFRDVFLARAANRLWAGWLWLVSEGGGVSLMHSTAASSPLLTGRQPLLALDLWELAYHKDYGDDRSRYAETFLHSLVDWEHAERIYNEGR